MRLFVTVELADRLGAEPLRATVDNRFVDPLPASNHPLAAFVSQLVATYLRLPHTCAQRRCAPDKASCSYTGAASLSLPEKPTLDRSV